MTSFIAFISQYFPNSAVDVVLWSGHLVSVAHNNCPKTTLIMCLFITDALLVAGAFLLPRVLLENPHDLFVEGRTNFSEALILFFFSLSGLHGMCLLLQHRSTNQTFW